MLAKPKICVDIDNVLNNMCAAMVDIYNDRHDEKIDLARCTRYDFSSYGEEVASELVKLFGDPELYERMRPARYAVEYLFLMCGEFDVKIVTSTRPEQLKQKCDWLARWFPFVKYRDIIVADHKQWIESDYVIDDHTGYLIDNPAYRILIDQPWNRNIKDYAYGICRVENLKDAYQIIKTQERSVEEEYDDQI